MCVCGGVSGQRMEFLATQPCLVKIAQHMMKQRDDQIAMSPFGAI